MTLQPRAEIYGTAADPIEPSQHQSSTSPGIVSVEAASGLTNEGERKVQLLHRKILKIR
jgi:hypothetical protein